MKNYKQLKVIAILAVVICFGIAAIKPPVNEDFKNLQVLPKNIHTDTLDKIMESFTIGLKVDCKYCHVSGTTNKMEYEKDDKPEKEIARLMIRMNMDINKKYFHFTDDEKEKDNLTVTQLLQPVTCFTCHRGEPRPVDSLATR
ncbi:MAG TPA: c-type cytochrome [Ferruginibacter sp.]|nr:c-type cytochrome [Ferruginibacter sp.]